MNEMYKKRYDTMFENESKTEQDCAINVFYLLDLGNLVEIIRTIVLFIIQYCLDLRKPDLRKNLDLGKIVATTDFLVHKLFDLRKIF